MKCIDKDLEKQEYASPEINFCLIDDVDIICTSNENDIDDIAYDIFKD